MVEGYSEAPAGGEMERITGFFLPPLKGEGDHPKDGGRVFGSACGRGDGENNRLFPASPERGGGPSEGWWKGTQKRLRARIGEVRDV